MHPRNTEGMREFVRRVLKPPCQEFGRFGSTLALPSSEALSETLSKIGGSELE